MKNDVCVHNRNKSECKGCARMKLQLYGKIVSTIFGFRRIHDHFDNWRIDEFKWHFKDGIHFGYPLCCVLRFALDWALVSINEKWYTIIFKIRYKKKDWSHAYNFQPCNVFHK